MKNIFETPKFEIITLNCDVVYTSSGEDTVNAGGEAPTIPTIPKL